VIAILIALATTLFARAPTQQEPPPSTYEQLLARYAGGEFDAAVDQAAAR